MTATDYQRDRARRLGELASRASDPEYKRYLFGLAVEAANQADTMDRKAVAKRDQAASDPNDHRWTRKHEAPMAVPSERLATVGRALGSPITDTRTAAQYRSASVRFWGLAAAATVSSSHDAFADLAVLYETLAAQGDAAEKTAPSVSEAPEGVTSNVLRFVSRPARND
jgi:hypothetical protein